MTFSKMNTLDVTTCCCAFGLDNEVLKLGLQPDCLRLNPALQFPSDVPSDMFFNLSGHRCSLAVVFLIMKVRWVDVNNGPRIK